MYKYILFDLDGTLTDSAPGIIRCVQYALEKCGKGTCPDREHDAIGAQQNKIAIIGAGYGYSSPGELSAAGVRQIVSAPQDFAEFLL